MCVCVCARIPTGSPSMASILVHSPVPWGPLGADVSPTFPLSDEALKCLFMLTGRKTGRLGVQGPCNRFTTALPILPRMRARVNGAERTRPPEELAMSICRVHHNTCAKRVKRRAFSKSMYTYFLIVRVFTAYKVKRGLWTPIPSGDEEGEKQKKELFRCPDRGQFHYRAAFSSQIKSKGGNILGKVATLRIVLNVDGSPTTSKSHAHTSHSQTSRLFY